jgi:hypothetical protein
MLLNEKEFKLFKRWLRSHLAFGPVTVVFTKKDGTERIMLCTTNKDIIPVEPIHESNTSNPIDFPKKERKANEDVMPVYDLEAGHWKSFRWDSVKQIKLTIGEEIEHNNETQ